jgi:hypothetical protein
MCIPFTGVKGYYLSFRAIDLWVLIVRINPGSLFGSIMADGMSFNGLRLNQLTRYSKN